MLSFTKLQKRELRLTDDIRKTRTYTPSRLFHSTNPYRLSCPKDPTYPSLHTETPSRPEIMPLSHVTGNVTIQGLRNKQAKCWLSEKPGKRSCGRKVHVHQVSRTGTGTGTVANG